MQAKIAVACKAIRIFYVVLQTGCEFDEERFRRDIIRPETAGDSKGTGLQECSLKAVTKQSEAVKAFLIGHDPEKEQRRHPTMGKLDEGI